MRNNRGTALLHIHEHVIGLLNESFIILDDWNGFEREFIAF